MTVRTLNAALSLSAVLVTLLSLSGCIAILRHEIPATSNPIRTARYYRTQDVPNFAAGLVVDEMLRQTLFKGPRRCVPHNPTRSCGNWAPVWRIATVTVLALGRRELDKGYRESGALFNVGGALAWEVIRCALSYCPRQR